MRLWCNKFGSKYAQRLRRKHQGYGDTFFIDKVFVKIQGARHYLWCAVDQEGEVIDVFLQKRGNRKAIKNFFTRLLRKHPGVPRKIITDKLRNHGVAHRELILKTIHHSPFTIHHSPFTIRRSALTIDVNCCTSHQERNSGVCVSLNRCLRDSIF